MVPGLAPVLLNPGKVEIESRLCAGSLKRFYASFLLPFFVILFWIRVISVHAAGPVVRPVLRFWHAWSLLLPGVVLVPPVVYDTVGYCSYQCRG